ncbi:MAG: HEAT repeat domain-containing protein [Microcoleaceae cyanobacterium]
MTSDELIRAVDQADSADALLDAVEALANARVEEAIPTLIQVLGFNNPGAAVAAVDGLIALGTPAVTALLGQLDGYNYGARAWAVRVLSGVGDPRSLEILLDAAVSDFALSVRRAAARGLGTIQWEQLPIEQVPSAQERVFQALMQVSQDPEWIVRYAAIVGLQGLADSVQRNPAQEQPIWSQQATECLTEIITTDETLAVQARAQLALQFISSEAARN